MRKGILALIGGLVLAILLPLTTASAQASPATTRFAASTPQATAAAVKCKGKSCTGKNPQTMGCEKDAKTIANTRPGGGGPKVELRYSKKCRAGWARIQRAASWPFMLSVKNGPNYTEISSNDYRRYTKMAGKPLKFRACVKQYSSDAWTCTRWR
ncbi:MAG: DUF2690 domain-containing protein [Actinophytocola sp.]